MDVINRQYILSNKEILIRNPEFYKNDFGRVLVMAGSVGMAGAAIMCGSAVLKTGSGLLSYAVSKEIFSILQISVPEAICLERDSISLENLHESVAIGPGLGNHKSDAQLMKKILINYKGSIVIDADGLNNIVRYNLTDFVKNTKAQVIITPHLGEGARLLGCSIENRKKAVIELAEKYKAVAVLKGHDTLVAEPGGRCMVNATGNPGMATGGSGDVLTGIIASLSGQGLQAFEAAAMGVFFHGCSGDVCANKIGQWGMIAGDICNQVPEVMKDILNQED